MQPFSSLSRLALSATVLLASLSLISAASVPVPRQATASAGAHNRPITAPAGSTDVTTRSVAARDNGKSWRTQSPWDKDYHKKHHCRRRSGIIRVYNATDDSELGFVQETLDTFGLFGLTTNVTLALDIKFEICKKKCGVIGPLDIKTNNPSAPFFGGVVGAFSTNTDLSVGSPNYAYLAGVNDRTEPESPAQPGANSFSTATGASEDSETAIWYFDVASNELTPQWTNANGSEPSTHLVYAPLDHDFVITGDVATYQARFNGYEVYFILDED